MLTWEIVKWAVHGWGMGGACSSSDISMRYASLSDPIVVIDRGMPWRKDGTVVLLFLLPIITTEVKCQITITSKTPIR